MDNTFYLFCLDILKDPTHKRPRRRCRRVCRRFKRCFRFGYKRVCRPIRICRRRCFNRWDETESENDVSDDNDNELEENGKLYIAVNNATISLSNRINWLGESSKASI